MPDMVFRDPYILHFLQLSDSYCERDLETAILRDMEAFLLEMGSGFSFVTRQKRMVIDGEDHTLDLLFYHRRLRRLVAVELKLGKFKGAYKGQMELYLRWLEENEQESNEESPLGLILCAEGGQESIALLRLDQSGMGWIMTCMFRNVLRPIAVILCVALERNIQEISFGDRYENKL
jgi:hypothetical protein